MFHLSSTFRCVKCHSDPPAASYRYDKYTGLSLWRELAGASVSYIPVSDVFLPRSGVYLTVCTGGVRGVCERLVCSRTIDCVCSDNHSGLDTTHCMISGYDSSACLAALPELERIAIYFTPCRFDSALMLSTFDSSSYNMPDYLMFEC